jgi:hypothetical protein
LSRWRALNSSFLTHVKFFPSAPRKQSVKIIMEKIGSADLMSHRTGMRAEEYLGAYLPLLIRHPTQKHKHKTLKRKGYRFVTISRQSSTMNFNATIRAEVSQRGVCPCHANGVCTTLNSSHYR